MTTKIFTNSSNPTAEAWIFAKERLGLSANPYTSRWVRYSPESAWQRISSRSCVQDDNTFVPWIQVGKNDSIDFDCFDAELMEKLEFRPDPLAFNIWSGKEQAWWKADGLGYTKNREKAGLFFADEILELRLNEAVNNIKGADVLVPVV